MTPKTLKDTSTEFKLFKEFKRGFNIFADMHALASKAQSKTEKEYLEKDSKQSQPEVVKPPNQDDIGMTEEEFEREMEK